MTIEGIIANYADLGRLRQLEEQGHFQKGFASSARDAVVRYVERIFLLAAMDRVIPYPGPTVTTEESNVESNTE